MVFTKGWKPSPETKEKMSKAKKGIVPWNKGLKDNPSLRGFRGKHTDETKAKISANRKGKCLGNSHGFTKGMTPWNKGIPYFVHTDEWKNNVSNGITLCRSCHALHHKPRKPPKPQSI